MWTFLKLTWELLFPPKYNKQYFQIYGVRHSIGCDPNLFNSETVKLYQLLEDYFTQESELFKGYNVGRSTCLAYDLLKLSPISICGNLDGLMTLLGDSQSNSAAKRWQDLITYVYTIIDPDVIDAYIGRYFLQVTQHHSDPIYGMTSTDLNNILDQYRLCPWSWILVPYVQINAANLPHVEALTVYEDPTVN